MRILQKRKTILQIVIHWRGTIYKIVLRKNRKIKRRLCTARAHNVGKCDDMLREYCHV